MRVIWQGTPKEMADLIKAMIGQPKETEVEEFATKLIQGWKSAIRGTTREEVLNGEKP